MPSSRPATAAPQAHSPSRIINELYSTNRYNLRSANPDKLESQDLKILGLSVVSSDDSNIGKTTFKNNKSNNNS